MSPTPVRQHPCRADRWEAGDRLDREDVSGPVAAIRVIAADDGYDRGVAMEDRIGDRPPFVADAYEIASLWCGRWHSAAVVQGPFRCESRLFLPEGELGVAETSIRQRPSRGKNCVLRPFFQARDGR